MRCVLITGATGAVGSALVPLFLREADTRVRLVLRAKDTACLQERLAGLVRFWGNDLPDPSVVDRVEAFRGDVSLPNLGLSAGEFDRLSREVTHVVHSAGNVKLNMSIEEARRSAVAAAEHVVALARACQRHGRFGKMEFVSTVGVAGRTPGLIREELLTHDRRFHNTYERAKAEAETFLAGEMRAGLPVTVHRPSMVVGDARAGKIIHFQVFYYLAEFFSGKNTCGVVPNTGRVRLDIIPVDYVAAAIHLSSLRPEAAGRTFHLCGGPADSPLIADLTADLRRLFRAHGASLPTLLRVPPGLLGRGIPLARRVVSAKTGRLLQSLPFFLDYLEEEQVFDDTRARAFFGPLGLHPPKVSDYLPLLIRYYWSHKYGKPGPEPAR